jgi:GAF domain-containing protein
MGMPAMVTVSRALADRISDVTRLLESDEMASEALRRLTGLGVDLIPGVTAVAVSIAADDRALTFAASDPRISELHRLQFDGGEGPVAEVLEHNEPRRVDDTSSERRWPAFCREAARAGFGSCLVLPLRTDRRPAGAVALYGQDRNVFQGDAHDVALLFAAQGGTAVHNAALYRACRQMVDSLHTALQSQAVIEQAKGILHARFGVTPEQAFQLLSRVSQRTNRKVRLISADLVEGRMSPEQFAPPPD